MRVVIYLTFLIGTFSLYGAYFDHPPSGWQCVEDREQLPKTVHVLYVGKGQTRFAPTIHLSSERITLPFEEYIQAAKHYHQRVPGATCHDLGKIETQSGTGRIIQIESSSVYGDMCLIQAYVFYEGCAFVVTGTVLKDEFSTFNKTFHETVRSLHLKNDLRVKTERG